MTCTFPGLACQNRYAFLLRKILTSLEKHSAEKIRGFLHIFYFCSMMYAYVIYNLEHHRFYYGICADPEKTERAHNEGLIEETRGISPWTMVYHEKFETKQQAVRRLRFFRSPAGQLFLKRTLHY